MLAVSRPVTEMVAVTDWEPVTEMLAISLPGHGVTDWEPVTEMLAVSMPEPVST